MKTPESSAPEPVEDELASAEGRMREMVRAKRGYLGRDCLAKIQAEYDRMRAELSKTLADCGICKLGGRVIHINDGCPRHGDDDGFSW